jgi:hypothetical protein
MTTTTTHRLETEIEDLICRHIAAQRAAAVAAIERAFAAAAAASTTRRQRPTKRKAERVQPARKRTQGKRRPSTEVAGLSERLCEIVRAHPGETMSFIASQLGESARALNRPMLNLKAAGRVRSAGQRQYTRYFPMTSSRPGAATR